jgi:hypothetical protein
VCRRFYDDYAVVAGNYVECTNLHRKIGDQGAGYVDGGAASWVGYVWLRSRELMVDGE